jgi:hypothetical protein
MPFDMRRGKTSRDLLEVDWTYPMWKPEALTVTSVARALPRADAFAVAAAGDPRPLLVLRECERCQGTDHALLTSSLEDEQTVLLTHWFHCVRLPPNVLDAVHPFRHLFDVEKGAHVPHLYFCDADGSNQVPVKVGQGRAELWQTMFGFLDRAYQGDARKAVKELRALLGQFDRVDVLEQDLARRIEREGDNRSADSDKLGKYQADRAALRKERDGLLAREQKIRELGARALAQPAVADR